MILLAQTVACSGPDDAVRRDPSLDAWVQDLASEDLWRSEEASERLVGRGADALPALEDGLRSGDLPVRLAVVGFAGEELGSLGSSLLLRAAADANADVRAEAVGQLAARRDPEAAGVVVAALGDSSSQVRYVAAVACPGLCRDAESIEAFSRVACERLDDRLIRGAQRLLWEADERERALATRIVGGVASGSLSNGVDRQARDAAAVLAAMAGRGDAAPRVVELLDTTPDLMRRTALALALLATNREAARQRVLEQIAEASEIERGLICRSVHRLRDRLASAESVMGVCSAFSKTP